VLISTEGIPPLKSSKWSQEFRHFLNCCLQRDAAKRPSAAELLSHPFFSKRCTAEDFGKHFSKHHTRTHTSKSKSQGDAVEKPRHHHSNEGKHSKHSSNHSDKAKHHISHPDEKKKSNSSEKIPISVQPSSGGEEPKPKSTPKSEEKLKTSRSEETKPKSASKSEETKPKSASKSEEKLKTSNKLPPGSLNITSSRKKAATPPASGRQRKSVEADDQKKLKIKAEEKPNSIETSRQRSASVSNAGSREVNRIKKGSQKPSPLNRQASSSPRARTKSSASEQRKFSPSPLSNRIDSKPSPKKSGLRIMDPRDNLAFTYE